MSDGPRVDRVRHQVGSARELDGGAIANARGRIRFAEPQPRLAELRIDAQSVSQFQNRLVVAFRRSEVVGAFQMVALGGLGIARARGQEGHGEADGHEGSTSEHGRQRCKLSATAVMVGGAGRRAADHIGYGGIRRRHGSYYFSLPLMRLLRAV